MSVTTDRINAVQVTAGYKAPVRVTTTGAIVLSGLQDVDGVTLTTGDRVLVRNQASAVENGIYEVTTSAWKRTPDFDGPGDARSGCQVTVAEGSTLQGKTYRLETADPISIGTSLITWTDQVGNQGPAGTDNAGTITTSVSSVEVGFNGKTFITVDDREFKVGNWVQAVSNGASSNWMWGQVTSWVSGTKTLTLNVTRANGSGTYSDWNIAGTGAEGPQGTPGTPGAPGAPGQDAETASTTSATSLAIDLTPKTLVLAENKPFIVGQFCKIVSRADTGNMMWGRINAWTPGTLTLEVIPQQTGGAGTFTDWNVFSTGPAGSLTAVADDPQQLINAYRVKEGAVAIVVGVLTINYLLGNDIEVTLDQNVTSVVINNWPPNGRGVLYVTTLQDATGGRTWGAGFPTSVKWIGGGTVIEPTAAANAEDLWVFRHNSADGANVYTALRAGADIKASA